MVTQNNLDVAARMRAELSRSLVELLDNSTQGWPRCQVHRPPPAATAMPSAQLGLNVLVVGDLTLEVPVQVETTRAELRTALRSGQAERVRWRMAKARLGGFVAHASRVATALGARVSDV